MTRIFLTALLSATVLTVAAQTYTIDEKRTHQTIRHFGASDAWSMPTIGRWPDEQQRQIADWLFSLETDADGQPRGIGLSLWRFNLGAGSSEQGDSSYINKGTRTECFLQYDGRYDWSRQAAQVRFMKMAKERGCPRLLAFLNSPPVYFTENELATNTGRGGTLNLRQECYPQFAEFMAQTIAGLEREHGLHIDYLSPINEPDGHWNWQGPKQEGSPATNWEIAEVVRQTSKAFDEHGLQTQIVYNESSDLRCLLGIYKTTWERGNAIAAFLSKDSTQTYLGDVPHTERLILGHSYWTNTPVDYMKKIRMQLRDRLKKYGARFWQSEVCIMSNDEEIGGGNGYDFTMKTALYVARIIHHDLCYADAESWSWWRACGGNYKDGLIRLYTRPAEGKASKRSDVVGDASKRYDVVGDASKRYNARDSRLLWALGNYSRFIRPGAVRLEVSSKQKEDPYGLMVSAFRNQDGSLVCVAINYGESEAAIMLKCSRVKMKLQSLEASPAMLQSLEASPTMPQSLEASPTMGWSMYRTSDAEGETLKPVGTTNGDATLPPRSITTFVMR